MGALYRIHRPFAPTQTTPAAIHLTPAASPTTSASPRGLPLIDFHPVLVAVFAAYFAALIAIAVVGARQMHQMSDYVLGGRRVSSITSALSASSSSASGWTMLVLPALAFAEGAVHVWTALSIVVGAWMSWTVMGKRLRRYTIELDSLTIPDFLEKRFHDRTGVLRGLASVLTILFIMFYVNSGLIAGAKLLETVFDTSHNLSVLITLIAVASYTFIGGFLAVSRTDVFQALIMLAGFVILPLTLIFTTDEPFAGLGETTGFLSPFTEASGDPLSLVFMLSAVGWGLGAFGSQRVLQRFMAVESEEKIKPSRNIGAVWVVAIFSFGFLFGLVARPALAEMGLLDAVTDPELVYFVVSEQFFVPLLLLIGAVAATSAMVAPDSIASLVGFAWGGMGAAFGPALLLALYWRRFNFWGALSSMVAGTLIAAVWQIWDGGPLGLFDMAIAATPGFIVATAVAVAATLLTSKPTERVVSTFDRVTAPDYRSSPAMEATA